MQGSSVPRRGVKKSLRYQIFHGAGSIIHAGMKYLTEGVKKYTEGSNIP